MIQVVLKVEKGVKNIIVILDISTLKMNQKIIMRLFSIIKKHKKLKKKKKLKI